MNYIDRIRQDLEDDMIAFDIPAHTAASREYKRLDAIHTKALERGNTGRAVVVRVKRRKALVTTAMLELS